MRRLAHIVSKRLFGYGLRLRGTYYCRAMPGG